MFKTPVERLQTDRRDGILKGCFAARREVLPRRIDRILADGFSRGELARPIEPADRRSLGTLISGAMMARTRLEPR